MNIGITGIEGLIGSAIAKNASEFADVYSYPRKDLDYLFLFGSPSSNIIFDQNLDYCMEETINSFLNAIQFCRDNNIKLIYPSSATVYNKNTTYAKCKSILEEIHAIYGGNVLGCRIFAGYGYEEHKGQYASVVYQFCKAMKKGDRPVIFGDGMQTRDFIYVDDVADIILLDTPLKTGIMDVGTGINTTFNDVVNTINKVLETDIKPIYVDKPETYVDDTLCINPCLYNVSLEEGIRRILEQIQ